MRRSALLMALLAAPSAAWGELRAVNVDEPRAFGYFIGDEFRRTVEIETGPDDTILSASLPRIGPSNYWLELKSLNSTTEQRSDARVHKIELTYQAFYAPIDPRKVTVPAAEFTIRGPNGDETASIPPFTLIMSPIREIFPEKSGESAETFLRPDAPLALRRSGYERTAALASAALSALFLLLLARDFAWWPFSKRPARPFSRAGREIAAALASGTDGYRSALLALHRAFDTAAGQRLLAGDVESFFNEHPQFASARGGIERFFEASRAVFFGDAPRQGETTLPATELRQLVAELARQERAAG